MILNLSIVGSLPDFSWVPPHFLESVFLSCYKQDGMELAAELWKHWGLEDQTGLFWDEAHLSERGANLFTNRLKYGLIK